MSFNVVFMPSRTRAILAMSPASSNGGATTGNEVTSEDGSYI